MFLINYQRKEIHFAYQIGVGAHRHSYYRGVVNCYKLVIFWVASLKMLSVHIL